MPKIDIIGKGKKKPSTKQTTKPEPPPQKKPIILSQLLILQNHHPLHERDLLSFICDVLSLGLKDALLGT